MKRLNRITQHRAADVSEIKEFNFYRRENQKLKKSLARMRRELQKYENKGTFEEEFVPPSKAKCPECGSEHLKSVQLHANLSMVVCLNCQWRTKK